MLKIVKLVSGQNNLSPSVTKMGMTTAPMEQYIFGLIFTFDKGFCKSISIRNDCSVFENFKVGIQKKKKKKEFDTYSSGFLIFLNYWDSVGSHQ